MTKEKDVSSGAIPASDRRISKSHQERKMAKSKSGIPSTNRLEIVPDLKALILLKEEKLNVAEEVKKDTKKRLESNEQNSINFYDIIQMETIKKKTGKGNFKSRRFPSDLALVRGTKFYQKPSYNTYEQVTLSELKKTPGKGLLMNEIYHQLEENFDEQEQDHQELSNHFSQDQSHIQDLSLINHLRGHNKSTLTLPNINKSTDSISLKNSALEKEIEGLDDWYKSVKKERKQIAKVEIEDPASSAAKQSKFKRTKTRTKTNMQSGEDNLDPSSPLSPKKLNERMKSFSMKTRDNILNIAKKQFADIKSSFDVGPQNSSLVGRDSPSSNAGTPFSGQSSKVNLVDLLKHNQVELIKQIGNNIIDQAIASNQKEHDKQESDADEHSSSHLQTRNPSKMGSFREIFINVVKSLNESQKHDEVPSNVREIKKSVLQYVNEVPNFHSKDENSFQKQDLTPEGIKRILQTFFTIDPDTEKSMNMVEKAKTYEKISTLVETKLSESIRDTEALIINKSNTVRILRLENHTIAKKMRQIRELTTKLQQDLKDLTNQTAEKDDSEILGIKLPEMKKLVSSTDLASSKRIGSSLSLSTLNTRQHMIESVMVTQNRIQELQKELAILKESYQKFEIKSIYNSEIITSIEIQVDQKRKEFKQFTQAKKVFLYEILKNGQDSRSEGLSWIISQIVNLGEKVFDSHLPDFLDAKAKDFLLQKSTRLSEINEIDTLQSISLDIYKTNMSMNDPSRSMDVGNGQSLDGSIFQNNSQMSSIFKPSNNISLPPIQNSGFEANQSYSFSQVDVKKIKQVETQLQKDKIMKNLDSMFEFLTKKEIASIEASIDQLNTTKLTSHNIIYNETKKKIQQLLKKNTQEYDLKKNLSMSALASQSQLTNVLHTNPNNVSNFLEGLENESSKLNHKIVLYDDNVILNKYNNREEFIKEYEALSKKLKEKQKQLKIIEDKELTRVIKEFDFKNYEKRFSVSCGVVLSALFGCSRADREIIKNGMNKR